MQRPLLVQDRKKKLILLLTQMKRVKRELGRRDTDPSQDQKDIFDEELNELLKFTEDDSEYAGMCRFFVKQFLKDNNLS